MIFGQDRKAAPDTGDKPDPGLRRRLKQDACERIGTRQQAEHQGRIRHRPGRRGHAKNRGAVQRQRRPEAGLCTKQPLAQPKHLPGCPGKQQQKWQADGKGRFAAQNMGRQPAHPPCKRRMIIGAQGKLAPGGDQIGFINAQPRGGRECQSEAERHRDQQKNPLHRGFQDVSDARPG